MKGSIQQRGPGTWRIRYDRPSGGKRKQVSETVRGDRREAERVLHQRLGEVPRQGEPTRETLGEYLEKWLDAVAVSARTRYGYREKVRNYIIPELGRLPLSGVTQRDIQALYGQMRVGDRTKLHTHRILNQAMSQAVRWGILTANPCQGVIAPRPERQEVQVWDWPTIQRFEEMASRSPYWPALHTALYTGLRRSEICGLRWSQVDLSRRVIRVTQGRQRIPQVGMYVGPPKSKGSQRGVLLCDQSVTMLRNLDRSGEWVFTHRGRLVNPDALTNEFLSIVRLGGFPPLTLHGLRHCHASLLLSQGVNAKVLQERLGHGSVSLTLDVYSHLMPGMQESAVTALDGLVTD